MRPAARVYITAITLVGAAILAHGLWNWQSANIARFLLLFVISAVASGMKVSLGAGPGSGTMSMNFLFVLLSIQSLSIGEALVIGVAGIMVQRLVRARKKPTVEQLLFNTGSISCSITAAYNVYHEGLTFFGGKVEVPMLLLLAAVVFFLINTFSVALVTALIDSRAVFHVWRTTYFWSFPNHLLGAAVAYGIYELSRWFGWQTSLLVLPVLYAIYRSHRVYVERLEEAAKHAQEQLRHAEELAALNRRTIETLALAIEAKDQTTHDHLARVEVYAIEIGKELGLSCDELKALEAAALLHDIGKLAVPEYIVTKPGKLTPEEFETMKIHPIVGAELIEQVHFPYPVAPIVRAHHEKWNGSGYPDGIAGEDIPIGARILAAVDCLDALASDRQYRRALPLPDALAFVLKQSGVAFDPRVVEVLARRHIELERMAKASAMSNRNRLSTDIRVERGAAPDAGFESGTRDLLNLERSVAEKAASEALERLDQELRDSQTTQVRGVIRDIVRDAIPYDTLVVFRRDGRRLVCEFSDGIFQDHFRRIQIPVGIGLAGWVAENHKSILNGNPSVEPGFLSDPTMASPLNAALAVPLEFLNEPAGVLSLYRRDADAFTSAEMSFLQGVAQRVARAWPAASQEENSVS
ncbi:hypothetical protein F183_A39900 [Bryobacterales bacterium F-183]|nr:hypothetical protein F183_A39900 [Bryobacterales bacterium F-183]